MPCPGEASIGQRHQEVEHQRGRQRECHPYAEISTECLGASQVSGRVDVPCQRANCSRRGERVHD